MSNIFNFGGDFGGPICDIISFSTLNDIFPNFFLITKALGRRKIEFALEKLRPKKQTSCEETTFIQELLYKLYSGRTKLNEDLFIRLLRLKYINPGSWWGHPFVNDSVSMFLLFVNFGHKKLVDFCVSEKYEIVESCAKDNYFSNNIGYCSEYSTLECFRWFCEFYDVKEKIKKDPFWVNVAYRGAIDCGKIEILEYLIDNNFGNDFPKDLGSNFAKMIGKELPFDQIFGMIKYVFSKYQKSRIDENSVLGLCHDLQFAGDEYLEIIDFIFNEENDHFEDLEDTIQQFGENLVDEELPNLKSMEYLYTKYQESFDKIEKENIDCFYVSFNQHEILQKRVDKRDKLSVHTLPFAIARGNYDMVKYIIGSGHIVREELMSKAFMLACKKGYFKIIKLLVDHSTKNNNKKIKIKYTHEHLREAVNYHENVDGILYLSGIRKASYLLKRRKTWGGKGYHFNEEDNELMESERAKILKLLLDLNIKEMDPNKIIKKVASYPKLAKICLDDTRFDPSTNFLLFCSNSYDEDLFFRVIEDKRVDPSFKKNKCLKLLVSRGRFKAIIRVLEDKRVDPTIDDCIFVKYLSSSFFYRKEQIKEYIEMIDFLRNLEEERRVDFSVENNLLLERLFERERNLEIIKHLLNLGDDRIKLTGETFINAIIRSVKGESDELLKFLLDFSGRKDLSNELLKKDKLSRYRIVTSSNFDPDEEDYEIDWKKVGVRIKEIFPKIDLTKEFDRNKYR